MEVMYRSPPQAALRSIQHIINQLLSRHALHVAESLLTLWISVRVKLVAKTLCRIVEDRSHDTKSDVIEWVINSSHKGWGLGMTLRTPIILVNQQCLLPFWASLIAPQ